MNFSTSTSSRKETQKLSMGMGNQQTMQLATEIMGYVFDFILAEICAGIPYFHH